MKRFGYIGYILIAIIMICICYIDFSYAQEFSGSYDFDDINSDDEALVKSSIELTEKYCQKYQYDTKGCMYNPDNELYSQSGKISTFNICYCDTARMLGQDGDNCIDDKPVSFEHESVPLTKGYVAFDGDGNAIFAGCYRFTFDENNNALKPTDLNSNMSNKSCSMTLYAQWEANSQFSWARYMYI